MDNKKAAEEKKANKGTGTKSKAEETSKGKGRQQSLKEMNIDRKVKFADESMVTEMRDMRDSVLRELEVFREERCASEALLERINQGMSDLSKQIEDMNMRLVKLEECEYAREGEVGGEVGSCGQNTVDFSREIETLNIRLAKLEECELAREEEVARGEGSSEGEGMSEKSGGSEKSGMSRANSVSQWSECSRVSLSEREVWRVKKMMNEMEKKDRECNIVIRGAEIGNIVDIAKWTKQLIDDRLGVAVNLVSARISGPVIVGRLGNIGEKREVMKNKGKLMGTKIFIENDLTFEERKKQEEIVRWVKEKIDQGWNVKVGYGKVLWRNNWRKWSEKEVIEKEMQQNNNNLTREDVDKTEEIEKRQTIQNFVQPRNQ